MEFDEILTTAKHAGEVVDDVGGHEDVDWHQHLNDDRTDQPAEYSCAVRPKSDDRPADERTNLARIAI
jgi:hypothetical protein